MVGRGRRAVAWLGLRADPDAQRREGLVPSWHGAPRRRRWVAGLAWLAVGVVLHQLLSARVPEQDGFGGFLPLWGAVVVASLGLAWTERASLRVPSRR
ncbi:hypothetical protein [uncultured Pseudokineococcus sp.]|uniref:hypothetical protein n=1 Tax=uncultured Pseudokineococcus sp. TaxID=1642928 RepID=UPI00260E2E53|nr:hypothetical protein [uncultured Pseudokineococcus sp.]